MTTQIISHGTAKTYRPAVRVLTLIQAAMDRIQRVESQVVTHEAIARLNKQQLDDIGIKSAGQPKPILHVKAGLMANLMSLR